MTTLQHWIPAFAGMTYLTSHFLVRHAEKVGAFRYPGLFDDCAE
jgi:hypothetical protein